MTSQVRLMAVVELLSKGDVLRGTSVSQLAAELQVSAPIICRDLAELVTAGWAEQTKVGAYRISAIFGQFSLKVRHAFERAALELQEEARAYGTQ